MAELKGKFAETFWGRAEEKYYEKGGEPGTFDPKNVKAIGLFDGVVSAFTDVYNSTVGAVGGGIDTVKKYAPLAIAATAGLLILSRRR